MKAKVLFSIFAISAVFAGCAKELSYEENIKSNETREGYLTISGTMFDETRMTVSDETTPAKGIWAADDKLCVYASVEDSTVSVGTLALQSGSGTQTATFSGPVSLTAGQEFSLVYKGSSADSTANCMVIAKNQTVNAGEASLSNGVYAYCDHLVYGTSTTFSLTHNEAIVKFIVSTSGKSLEGMTLQSVSLYSPDAWLAGQAKIAPFTGGKGTILLKEESEGNDDFVKASLSKPVAVDSVGTTVWMTAIPASFDSTDVYAVAKFASEDGLTVVNAVKKFTGKALKEGQINVIKLAGLTSETSDVVWYNPCCSRYVGAEWDLKYAYGTSNTIFSTIDATSHKTPVLSDIDVRLNSPLDFVEIFKGTLKANTDPEYIGIPAKLDCYFVGSLSVNGGDMLASGTPKANTMKKDFTITDCKFNIQLLPSNYNSRWYNGCFGIVYLKDASGKRLWGMNLWTSDEEIKEITLPSGKYILADKCVGGGNYDNCVDGKRIDAAGPYYIQWGRTTGIGWGQDYKQIEIKHFNQVTTLKEAVGEYCDYFIGADKIGSTTNNNWFGGSIQHDDLWGNPSETADGNTINTKTGVKTILDPCPKGWMVACPAAMEEVANGIEPDLSKLGDTDDYWMQSCGLYLPFSGIKWNGKNDNKSVYNSIYQSATCRTTECGMWTNSSWSTAKPSQARHYIWQAKSVENPETLETTPTATRYGAGEATGVKGKVIGMQVRCMKDTANR